MHLCASFGKSYICRSWCKKEGLFWRSCMTRDFVIKQKKQNNKTTAHVTKHLVCYFSMKPLNLKENKTAIILKYYLWCCLNNCFFNCLSIWDSFYSYTNKNIIPDTTMNESQSTSLTNVDASFISVHAIVTEL